MPSTQIGHHIESSPAHMQQKPWQPLDILSLTFSINVLSQDKTSFQSTLYFPPLPRSADIKFHDNKK